MNIEYNIHGWLGLRLVDPSAGSARYLARELDPLVRAALPADPDVSLIAVPHPLAAGTAYRIGNAGDYQECAFTDVDFCLVNGGRMLCIPFESVGRCCEVRYTTGSSLRSVLYYVRPVLHLSLLNKAAIAVHSAAVLYNGGGILFAGWAESGKTELMLGFLHRGASFISDKWTILEDDGSAIYNFPSPVTVRAWVMKYLPHLARNLVASERWRLQIGSAAHAVWRTAVESGRIELDGALGRFLAPAFDQAARVSVPPSRLFRRINDRGGPQSLSVSSPLRKVFFLVTRNSPQVSVRPADPANVARRLVDCAQYERRGFLGLYTRFKYALPGRRNTLIEEAPERELAALTRALESKEVFLVEMPFPFDPLAAHDAVSRFC